VDRRPDEPTRRALALALPWIPILGGLGAALAPSASAAQGAAPPPERKRLVATVILLRHAEKDTTGDSVNPGLSDVGKKRAADLARLLARARVTHLFASKYRRAQETLQPFAEASGLKVNTDLGAVSVELGPYLLGLPAGSVAVVAGHSNTIPALAAALGGELQGLEPTPQGPSLSEKEYARLFVLTPGPEPTSKPLVLELSYGD